MKDISTTSVLSTRFRTSGEAENITRLLMERLYLTTKANVARLCIGRSLSLGPLQFNDVDSKGLDIPAQSLFTPKDVNVWISLIKQHSVKYGLSMNDMDNLRTLIRMHWHRGAVSLYDDWIGCNQSYEEFLKTLIHRRAELPEFGLRRPSFGDTDDSLGIDQTAGKEPDDLRNRLHDLLQELNISATITKQVTGPRITRFFVSIDDLDDIRKLKKSGESIMVALNLEKLPAIGAGTGDGARTLTIDIPRSARHWITHTHKDLLSWITPNVGFPEKLIVIPGVNVMGEPISFDLATAPHLFIAGTTGSGKSVVVNSLVLSLILSNKPDRLKLIMIDPKRVEFSSYKNLPHLHDGNIVDDTKQARETLKFLVTEMENRYKFFSELGAEKIEGAWSKGANFPRIVVVIDEIADLLIQDRDSENTLVRLAQKARASGIHLILATQRPDAKTFSGLLRSNIPSRIALQVQKSTDSKIILDETGAEQLVGKGDMLIKGPNGFNQVTRAHGILVTPEDIVKVVGQIKD